MSRSSRAGAAALVLGLLGTTLASSPASAAPGMGTGEARVVPIVAPVLDIVFADADLQRTARVENGPRRTKITLDSTVLFARDSPKINRKARSRLDEVGRQLRRSGPGRVAITGYTDDLGSAAHGLTLSRQRARAVASVLRDELPEAEYAFTVTGRGEADPAVPNTSERNRKINRRVVLVYTRR